MERFGLASAYRGKKGDFVSVGESSVPGGEFPIAGSDKRIAKAG
jgi:hypothetical protein